MAFSTKLTDRFGKNIEQSPYVALEPIVKCNFVQKGRNLIFGRQADGGTESDLIYLGKVFETATGSSMLGTDAWLDTRFPHVIYITGTRGSGKSMDLGVLIEGLATLKSASPIKTDITPVATFLIDTQSQFWTLKYAPKGSGESEQVEQLRDWGLAPNQLADADVFIPPATQGVMGDEKSLRIRPRDVLHEEWCDLLDQDVYSPQGHLLAEILEKLGQTDFSIEDMLTRLREGRIAASVAESSRNVLIYRLSDYARTGLFHPSGLDISKLLSPGRCNIFMLRDLRDDDKALVSAILARQLFLVMGRHHQARRLSNFFDRPNETQALPSRVWLLIDEAHVICPNTGKSLAREALVEYVKRGRDAGLSLVLATQQPSAVDDRVLSQVNISFSHRLTFQSDINAAEARIPTKTLSSLRYGGSKLSDFGDVIRTLDAGYLFVGDHATSRAILIQMRPRITAHGGTSPL
ncbi:ATP-binding protein [Pinirhizobacter soli]|uniref:ATP-binding protein n=1 Tax=Pinirhizobacter soli TaxID=2786953 RepID=UPI00202ABA1D|nr:DUF87 domain-containing protein [Pinirhizobacter soli]